ncbi:HSP20-like chaperone [Ilyonectria sp. MPI-CAGE-AT-0026]|nr:HSP20-like chaperone [Ilyonectria sp. MPI-CAGE-AT-0026]
MALFPREFYDSDVSFTPLFRLLDDFNNYSRQGQGDRRTGLPHWQPKFDVHETDKAYQLHGELPGMKKEEVHIEFTDTQTMVIRGKTERTYTSGTPSAGLVEDTTKGAAITGAGDEHKTSRQGAVGDEAVSTKPAEQTKEVEKKPVDSVKYWLTERSVGEFSRSFSFPASIDQDSVSASFKDGILTIVVPKVKKHESCRIHVS